MTKSDQIFVDIIKKELEEMREEYKAFPRKERNLLKLIDHYETDKN